MLGKRNILEAWLLQLLQSFLAAYTRKELGLRLFIPEMVPKSLSVAMLSKAPQRRLFCLSSDKGTWGLHCLIKNGWKIIPEAKEKLYFAKLYRKYLAQTFIETMTRKQKCIESSTVIFIKYPKRLSVWLRVLK